MPWPRSRQAGSTWLRATFSLQASPAGAHNALVDVDTLSPSYMMTSPSVRKSCISIYRATRCGEDHIDGNATGQGCQWTGPSQAHSRIFSLDRERHFVHLALRRATIHAGPDATTRTRTPGSSWTARATLRPALARHPGSPRKALTSRRGARAAGVGSDGVSEAGLKSVRDAKVPYVQGGMLSPCARRCVPACAAHPSATARPLSFSVALLALRTWPSSLSIGTPDSFHRSLQCLVARLMYDHNHTYCLGVCFGYWIITLWIDLCSPVTKIGKLRHAPNMETGQ